jgi:hypothetical protein
MANAADSRITIKNRDTGEIAHGIRGHVPPGWEEVKNAAEEHEQTGLRKVETPRSSSGAPVREHVNLPKRPVQTVPGKARDETSRESGHGDAA